MLKQLLAIFKPAIAFFTPPVFPGDEDKTRKASYAHSIALAFSGAVIAYELFLRVTRPLQTFAPADIVMIALAFVGIISWWFVRKGYVLFTSIMLIVLIWTGANGIAASGYGIRDTSFIVNFVIMLIAALLLGWQAAAIIAVMSIVAAFGLAYAEAGGLIVTTVYPVTSFAQDIAVVLGLGGFFIYILINGLENAIKRSRTSLMELEAANTELSQAQADLNARSLELITTNKTLQKRTERLRTVAEVARTATAVQNFDQLLSLITPIISKQLGYYHVGIFLVDDDKQFAILRSANTDGGLKMLARGHRLKVGEQGIVGFVTQTGNPRIALDVGQDPVFFNNPDLPNTSSELALPLKASGKIIGVLDLQSTEVNGFIEDDVSLLTILADQVAISIQNALSSEQAQRSLREAEIASSQLTGLAWKGHMETTQTKGYRYDGVKSEALKDASASRKDKDGLSMPIQLRGQTIGHLKLKASASSHEWTDDELAIIEATTERVALALDGARLLEDAQKRAARESFLSEMGTKLGASFQLDSILRDTVEELGQTLKGSTVSFQLVNPSAPFIELNNENK
jgi:GAF domain-containing protein